MEKKLFILIFLLFTILPTYSQSFEIRGVLPWHNFLSGPSTWNEEDYRKYLDNCQKHGINFIAFHNYTGGGECYFNYVEPMVKIQYKNVLPETGFEHSGTDYFGADFVMLARTNEERYKKAQALMKKVLAMAHDRNMEMAMGFEFGVAPPEYASIRTRSDIYWLGNGSIVYNPFDHDAAGILYATIDDILETYEGIDWIYLWLNEHCMFGIERETALENKQMNAYFQENEKDAVKTKNLEWLRANFKFILLLDEVGRNMEPAWKIRESVLSGTVLKHESEKITNAKRMLQEAPMEKLFLTFASRMRSRGELGELSSLNQRVWGEYMILNEFLNMMQ